MTIVWVEPVTGVQIKSTSDDGAAPTSDAVPVTTPAKSGRQIWNFTGQVWGAVPPRPPDPAHVALDNAIENAGSFEALKAVLKGKVGVR